jgi:hypothetical protein
MLDSGEVTSISVDANGELVATIEFADRSRSNVRIRQPAGFQARPMNDRDGHDAIALRDGRLCEILCVTDREATGKLVELPAGASRQHSLGNSPQTLTIEDNKIAIGKNATRGAARENDEVRGDRIILAVVSAVGPPPTVTITITYVNAKGTSTVIPSFVLLGTYAGPPELTISPLALIKTFSQLVKIE